jgi:hypothetical protein
LERWITVGAAKDMLSKITGETINIVVLAVLEIEIKELINT